MATINGEEVQAQGLTISDYLAQAGYNVNRVAVERNLEILSKSALDETVIQEGDVIEIVTFMGGG